MKVDVLAKFVTPANPGVSGKVVTPAKAGVQCFCSPMIFLVAGLCRGNVWIPAFAGMTQAEDFDVIENNSIGE
jgi:hypothetical protein